MKEIKTHPWFLKNLPRELTETAQAVYYRRDNDALIYSLQAEVDIMKAVREARTRGLSSKTVLGYGWAEDDEVEDEDKEDDYEEAEEEDEEYFDESVAGAPATSSSFAESPTAFIRSPANAPTSSTRLTESPTATSRVPEAPANRVNTATRSAAC